MAARCGNCRETGAPSNDGMYGSRDHTATIPLGTLPPRVRPAKAADGFVKPIQRKPRIRCLGCGWEAGAARQQVALEPGMLRAVLPWILAPWAALALVAWALWG
jgi:hypothetical protein